MNSFCSLYNLKSLVHEPTCFKNIDNPSCIDLILTNKSLCFQNTSVIDTGLSDFHKLTLTTMKASFQKQEPKILHYRNFLIMEALEMIYFMNLVKWVSLIYPANSLKFYF